MQRLKVPDPVHRDWRTGLKSNVLCVTIIKRRLYHPLVVSSSVVSELLPLWFSPEAFFQNSFPFFFGLNPFFFVRTSSSC